jgi:DNA polymerase III gamma/tau subunit
MLQALQSNPAIEFAQSAVQFVVSIAKKSIKAVLNLSDQISVANARSNQVQQLNMLTDRELADLYQINRDQIIPYVFRNKIS